MADHAIGNSIMSALLKILLPTFVKLISGRYYSFYHFEILGTASTSILRREGANFGVFLMEMESLEFEIFHMAMEGVEAVEEILMYYHLISV